jgi:hypothetical protein
MNYFSFGIFEQLSMLNIGSEPARSHIVLRLGSGATKYSSPSGSGSGILYKIILRQKTVEKLWNRRNTTYRSKDLCNLFQIKKKSIGFRYFIKYSSVNHRKIPYPEATFSSERQIFLNSSKIIFHAQIKL